MHENDLFAEFETLGEAQVRWRLSQAAFDDRHRLAAGRWLIDKREERIVVATAERQAAAKNTDRERARGLTFFLANLALVVAAAAVIIAIVLSHRSMFA